MNTSNLPEAIAVVSGIKAAAETINERMGTSEVPQSEKIECVANAVEACWYASDLLGGDTELEELADIGNSLLNKEARK